MQNTNSKDSRFVVHEIRGTTVFEDHSVSKETIMHLPLLGLRVDLSRAFVDRPVCGSLACIFVSPCGSFARVLWIVCMSVDLSHAFVGGFDTVFTPYCFSFRFLFVCMDLIYIYIIFSLLPPTFLYLAAINLIRCQGNQ